MKKRLNVKDVSGFQRECLQLARKLERRERARKKSKELLKKTAYLEAYLKKKRNAQKSGVLKGGRNA